MKTSKIMKKILQDMKLNLLPTKLKKVNSNKLKQTLNLSTSFKENSKT